MERHIAQAIAHCDGSRYHRNFTAPAEALIDPTHYRKTRTAVDGRPVSRSSALVPASRRSLTPRRSRTCRACHACLQPRCPRSAKERPTHARFRPRYLPTCRRAAAFSANERGPSVLTSIFGCREHRPPDCEHGALQPAMPASSSRLRALRWTRQPGTEKKKKSADRTAPAAKGLSGAAFRLRGFRLRPDRESPAFCSPLDTTPRLRRSALRSNGLRRKRDRRLGNCAVGLP